MPPDELAALVRPLDLRCVLRPGQSADDYLRRLTRLLEAKAAAQPKLPVKAAPAWTLDTLPLAPDVEAWARQVAADLAAYGAGTLPWHDTEHGALLSGPPGCGKTTLASALAASCGVPLIVTEALRTGTRHRALPDAESLWRRWRSVGELVAEWMAKETGP